MTTQVASQTAGNTGAAQANAGNAPTVTGSAEAKTLDNLLREFESSAAQPKAIDVLKPVEPVVAYVNGEMADRQEKALEADLVGAVASVKTEAGKDIPDKLVRGFLREEAAASPEFAAAWENRKSDPATWNTQLQQRSKSLAEMAKGFNGGNLRTDIEAASASVRNVSHSPQNGSDQPSPVKMFQMNDREWANYKASLDSGGR